MPPRKKQVKRKSIGKYLLGGFLACFAGFFYLVYDLPSLRFLAQQNRLPCVEILYADGSPLAVYGEDYGEKVDLTTLPQYVTQAVLSIEDRRFYHHWGVDFIGSLRAFWINLTTGEVRQGGSTITQQLAKNFLISAHLYKSNARSYKRKLQEVFLAFWLEYYFTKAQILTMYLNRAYLGGGAYGIDAAAKKYFRKPARDLSLFEAAVLAGALKAPTRYTPTTFSKERIKRRARIVLMAMAQEGYITTAQAKLASREEIRGAKNEALQSTHRYFSDWVYDQIPNHIGPIQEDIQVITTLSSVLQTRATEVLRKFLKWRERAFLSEECALLSVGKGGEIRALIGGTHYWNNPFNRALHARRQVGSLFKVLVFLPALEKGIPATRTILDAPITLRQWAPKNFNNIYYGTISLTDAFAYSANSATVRLAQHVGLEPIQAMARRLDITSSLPPDFSLCLGSAALTLDEILRPFHTIWQDGYQSTLYGIDKIYRTRDKKMLYVHPKLPKQRRIAAPVVHDMKGLLRAVTQYGTAKKLVAFNAYGKTGTSQQMRDAWFVGFDEEMLTGIWVGNDDNLPMKGITGGNVPVQLWGWMHQK